MTVEEFRSAVATCWKTAKHLLATQGSHAPQVIVFDQAGKASLALIQGGRAGQPFAPVIKAAVDRFKGQSFIFVNEAWIVTRPTDQGDLKSLAGKVHLQPDRKEVLWCVAVHPHWAGGHMLEFGRNERGEPVFGIERETPREQLQGDIVNLLNH